MHISILLLLPNIGSTFCEILFCLLISILIISNVILEKRFISLLLKPLHIVPVPDLSIRFLLVKLLWRSQAVKGTPNMSISNFINNWAKCSVLSDGGSFASG